MSVEGDGFGLETRIRISAWEAVIAGVAAWGVLNVFAYAAAPLFGITFGTTAPFFGSFLFPGASATARIWIGRALFFGAAVGWSFVYRRLGGSLPGTDYVRGFLFGTAIWVASALLLPIFGALHPAGGTIHQPGLFGLDWRGTSGLVLSVLAHQVYGITLGIVTAMQAGTE